MPDQTAVRAFPEHAREAGRLTIVRNADAFARRIAPVLAGLQAAGITSHSAISKALNASRVPTSRRGSWSPTTVRLLLKRIEKLDGGVVPPTKATVPGKP